MKTQKPSNHLKSIHQIIEQQRFGIAFRLCAKLQVVIVAFDQADRGVFHSLSQKPLEGPMPQRKNWCYKDLKWSFPRNMGRGFNSAWEALLLCAGLPLAGGCDRPSENGSAQAGASERPEFWAKIINLWIFDLPLLTPNCLIGWWKPMAKRRPLPSWTFKSLKDFATRKVKTSLVDGKRKTMRRRNRSCSNYR